MKKFKFFGMITSIIILSAFTVANSISWSIAEDFAIKFTSKDPSGIFTEMSGDISFDPDNLEASKFDVKIDVSSINTGNGMKNKHAKSPKWFDAEQYPFISFTSNSFSKTADGYEVIGNLEMHGISKEFRMPFTFQKDVFHSNFSINRLDYEIGDMEGMSAKVPAELAMEISVPVTKN